MGDGNPHALPALREANLVLRETRDYSITVANVTDMTERAAKAMIEVAEVTHVKPRRVIMRYVLGGTAMLIVGAGAVLWMKHAWNLDRIEVLGAFAMIGVPFSILSASVLPKILKDAAAGSVGG